MSQSDARDIAKHFAASPLFPQDEEGPVFAPPWQTQAFAMAVHLSAAGHFTWTEWTEALGEQLRAAVGRGELDDGSRYFEYWVAALEQLAAAKKLNDLTCLSERKEAWADSYRNTPHGQPVELGARFR